MYRSEEQLKAERALCYIIEHPQAGMMRELEVDGANGRYYATRSGDIVTLCHADAAVMTPTQRQEDGYCYVEIAGRKHYLHRLIALAYLVEEDPESKVVHHLDRDKRDNDISNLVYLDKRKHRQIHNCLSKWDRMEIV